MKRSKVEMLNEEEYPFASPPADIGLGPSAPADKSKVPIM
jgi:hypothetical protein